MKFPGLRWFRSRNSVSGDTLPVMHPSDADREQARAAILAALPTVIPSLVRDLVAALPALVVSDADREQARVRMTSPFGPTSLV
jgi:hypothetical protein